MISKKELQEQIFANEMIKKLLEQIEDTNQKEQTVKAIEGMLEQLQGGFSTLAQKIEEAAKK